MNAGWTITGCLAVAGLAAAWPYRTGRRRLGLPGAGPRRSGGLRAMLSTFPDLAGMRAKLASAAVRHPRRLIAGSSALAAVAGLVAGGPVAGVVGGVYSALAVRAATRRVAAQRAGADLARSLDGLGSLAGDLRAGLPPQMAARRAPVGTGARAALAGRIADLTAAVWRLAEQTGAPAADLVERIEADVRAADRARASAAAQAAGARATALLLAALPAGGIALGYAIGADPLGVLLHTPVGAVCAVGSAFLQCTGLLWSERLTSGPAR